MKKTQRDTNTPVPEHNPNRRLPVEPSPPREVEAEHRENDAPSGIRLLVMEVSSSESWIQITSASGASFRVPAKPETGPESQAGPSRFNEARANTFQFLARDRCKVIATFYLIQRNKVWTFCWEGHYQNPIVRSKIDEDRSQYTFIVPVPRARYLRFEETIYGLQNAEQAGEPLGPKVDSDWPD